MFLVMVILNSGMSYVSVEDIKQIFTTRSDCISCTKAVMLCTVFRVTVWHEIYVEVYFGRLAIFCVLRELIFANKTDWFFLLGINFCDFQKVPSAKH